MDVKSLYTVVIQTEADKEKYHDILNELSVMYDRYFADGDGKESFFGSILPRVGSEFSVPKTEIHVAYSDELGILGAAIYDVYGLIKVSEYYETYESVHLIYLFVGEKYRRLGIGSLLLQQGRQTYRDDTIYIEIDKNDDGVMNFCRKNYVSVILENYIQPPLQKDLDWDRDYRLCHIGAKPSNKRVWKFLVNFYKSVNALETEDGQDKINEMGKELNEGPIFINE